VKILVDTNVLLRRTQPDHPQHREAVDSIARLLGRNDQLYYTLQNMSEFWNVMTRPIGSNGLGFSTELAKRQVEGIEMVFELLPDVEGIYHEWKRLVMEHRVIGSKVHDARLVAAMRIHGVSTILTFNVGDFARYRIDAVVPASFLSA